MQEDEDEKDVFGKSGGKTRAELKFHVHLHLHFSKQLFYLALTSLRQGVKKS
jgi:hypothetical protein